MVYPLDRHGHDRILADIGRIDVQGIGAICVGRGRGFTRVQLVVAVLVEEDGCADKIAVGDLSGDGGRSCRSASATAAPCDKANGKCCCMSTANSCFFIVFMVELSFRIVMLEIVIYR